MFLAAINIGQSGKLTLRGRAVASGIFKHPVQGPIEVGELGLVGDVQVDQRYHGGPDKAINVYPSEHYDYWRETLGREWTAGAFGENFTTRGLLEDEVAIGDVFQLGEARFEVSQARQPCAKLAARHQLPGLVKLVESTGRTGFYLRCVASGAISPGVALTRVARPPSCFTVREAYQILRNRQERDRAAELLRVQALSAAWREEISRRFAE